MFPRGLQLLSMHQPEVFALPLVFPAPLRTYEHEPNFIKKYKTEICKNWEAGHCAFDSACTFAHGGCELRQKQPGVASRIKKCKQFAKMGFCENRSQCLYLHPVPFQLRKRLPIFEALEKKAFLP